MDQLIQIPIPTTPANGNGHGDWAAQPEQASFYRVLLRRRWYLARCSAVALFIFTAIAFLLAPEYESVARLMPPDHNDTMMLAALTGRMTDTLGLAASSLLGMRSSGALFVGIMSSNSVKDDIIRKFDLRKEYGAKRWESARKQLDGLTDITEDRKNGIITIHVRDKSRERAQQMCQAYID